VKIDCLSATSHIPPSLFLNDPPPLFLVSLDPDSRCPMSFIYLQSSPVASPSLSHSVFFFFSLAEKSSFFSLFLTPTYPRLSAFLWFLHRASVPLLRALFSEVTFSTKIFWACLRPEHHFPCQCLFFRRITIQAFPLRYHSTGIPPLRFG